MIEVTDDLGNNISLEQKPHRIVSLVPSQTELLAYLNLDSRVAGITRFCTHPSDWRKRKNIVGGTKDVDINAVEALKPDLIIGNKEENVKSQIESLIGLAPTFISDITSIQDVYRLIESLGILTSTSVQANQLNDEIKGSFDSLQSFSVKTCLYLIWDNPIMVAGKDSIINDVLRIGGFQNLCTESDSRYPEINHEEIRQMNPDVIFLSSEPYPFKEKNRLQFKSNHPTSEVLRVDARYFSWYGPIFKNTPDFLSKIRKEI